MIRLWPLLTLLPIASNVHYSNLLPCYSNGSRVWLHIDRVHHTALIRPQPSLFHRHQYRPLSVNSLPAFQWRLCPVHIPFSRRYHCLSGTICLLVRRESLNAMVFQATLGSEKCDHAMVRLPVSVNLGLVLLYALYKNMCATWYFCCQATVRPAYFFTEIP